MTTHTKRGKETTKKKIVLKKELTAAAVGMDSGGGGELSLLGCLRSSVYCKARPDDRQAPVSG